MEIASFLQKYFWRKYVLVPGRCALWTPVWRKVCLTAEQAGRSQTEPWTGLAIQILWAWTPTHQVHQWPRAATGVFLQKSFPISVQSLFSFLIFIVIQLQLCAFSPHPSTPPQPNLPPSPTSTLPLDFVHVSFTVVPVIPSPNCPLPTPPWLLLDYS